MKQANRAFTPVELVASTAVLSLVLSLVGVSTFRAKELSRRMVCSVNLRGIGAASKVYAHKNAGRWMIPGFMNAVVESPGVQYHPVRSTHSNPPQTGEVGYDRGRESESESPGGSGGSSAVTTTRAFWMLVRSGDVTVEQFICPSAMDDSAESTENIQLYYDFDSYNNISYGYQVPFGPTPTQPREGSDPGRINAADKGPFYFPDPFPNWINPRTGTRVSLNDPPRYWRRFNSPNHGGLLTGEGQNVLFADGHTKFLRKPTGGIDDDNIYTVMTDDWVNLFPPGANRIHGDTPHMSPVSLNPYPGQEALNQAPNGFSSTDTLVFP